MFRPITFVSLVLLVAAFVINGASASPAVSETLGSKGSHKLTGRALDIPQGTLDKAEKRSIVDVISHPISPTVHEEIPEGTFEPDADVVNVTERATPVRSSTITHDDSVTEISVDELKTTSTALAKNPSVKAKLPTSSRYWYGAFTGYSFYGTRCYAFPSYIRHAVYHNYYGYNCYGKIFYFRNYICFRAVCKALVRYWRY